MQQRSLRPMLLVALACACAPSSTREGMRIRAAEEWHCPESMISVTNQGRDTFRVSGCGESAIYHCAAEGGGPDVAPQGSMITEDEYRSRGAGCSELRND